MKPISILLVEDSKISQLATKIIINSLEYVIILEIAENANQAINKSANSRYDLILLDIGLPDQSGFSVAKEIRQFKAMRNTTIVALTAHDDNEYRVLAKNSGFNEYVVKPLDETKLIRILNDFINNEATETGK